LRCKKITWVKCFFWTPWHVLDDAETLKSLTQEIENDTGLQFIGFASGVQGVHPPPEHVALLRPLLENGVAWLQCPNDLEASPELWHIGNDETVLQSMYFGCNSL